MKHLEPFNPIPKNKAMLNLVMNLIHVSAFN